MSSPDPSRGNPAIIDATPEGHNLTDGEKPSSSLLSPPDISHSSVHSDPAHGKQRPQHPLLTTRSVSDAGPQRLVAPRIESSHSSGAASPLAPVQAARSGGSAPRPPSSSGSSGSLPGVSKLPAGMQAKMMAVYTTSRFSDSSFMLLVLLALHPLQLLATMEVSEVHPLHH